MLTDLIFILLFLVATFILAIVLSFTLFGPHTIKHFGHHLRWDKCKNCTAGTQWFNGLRGWGPIPPAARKVSDGVFTVEPPQANVRRCPHCLGTPGGHWVDRNGSRPLRNPGWREVPKGRYDDTSRDEHG